MFSGSPMSTGHSITPTNRSVWRKNLKGNGLVYLPGRWRWRDCEVKVLVVCEESQEVCKAFRANLPEWCGQKISTMEQFHDAVAV